MEGDNSWRDREREYRGTNWRERDCDNDRYMPVNEQKKRKEQIVNPENYCIEDILARILTKWKDQRKF